MPDGTLQILGSGTSAAPLDVPITGNQLLDLITVKADFDGSGAGVDFVPMVEVVSDAGVVMAQAKGPTVLAGDSATVTFFPFGAEETPGSGAGVTEVVSGDGTVFVTNPFGPVVDLSAYEPPADQEILTASLSIPNGTFDVFAFTHLSGANLMDLSTPAAPKFQLYASYGVTVLFTSGTPLSTGQDVAGFLDLLPVSGMNVGLRNVYAPGVVGIATEFTLSTVWHMSFNDPMRVQFRNDSGPALFDVDATLWIQRIT